MLDERTITVSAFAVVPARRRVRRVVISLVFLLVLLTVGTGAAYQALLNHTERTNLKQAALLPAPEAVLTPGERVPTREPAAQDAQNILLIGSDRRGTLAQGRSDIIVLAHVNSDRYDRRTVHLVHFPRDLLVDVPGHGKDKINAAYGYGGAPLLVRTLQQLLDVRIDHVAFVGYDGFSQMTDALGGLVVVAEKASTRPGPGAVVKGRNRLDGPAAIRFLRERRQPGESDISRGRRQLAFVKALMLKSLAKDAFSNRIVLAEFTGATRRNVTLDDAWSMADLRALASALEGIASKDIALITAPVKGFGKSPTGVRVNIVNAPKMAQLSTALRGDDMASFGTR